MSLLTMWPLTYSGPALGSVTQVLTTATWVVPAGVTSIDALVIGSGGSGRTGGPNPAGGGGGGGASSQTSGIAVTPGETLDIATGNPASIKRAGVTLISANGGTTATGITGGAGGTTGGIGTTKFAGAAGDNAEGTSSSEPMNGGQGGGASGLTAAVGADGSSPGGDGGQGGGLADHGQDGFLYGGGGGGGSNDFAGWQNAGSGATGLVRVTYIGPL